MSLQSSIHKLNSNLISLFARFDSWCDLGADLFLQRNASRQTPHAVLSEFLAINENVLGYLSDERADSIADTDSVKSLRHDVKEVSEKYLEMHPDELRDTLRDQLFGFLCIVDHIHSSRLDMSLTISEKHTHRGLEIIRSLVDDANEKVLEYESLYQLQ